MPYQGTVIKVVIASPSDVRPERLIAQSVIHEWNAIHSQDRGLVLLPLAWETHSAPAMGARAQEIINRQLVSKSDLLLAVFWTRVGTPTGESLSGTVEEIEGHITTGKPVMLYFSNQPAHPDTIDQEQLRAVREFKESARKRGLVEEYDSIEQFREKFSRQLAQTIIGHFPESNHGSEAKQQDNRHADTTVLHRSLSLDDRDLLSRLDPSAGELLLNAVKDRNGTVIAVETFGGLSIESNGKNFVESGSPRSEARGRRVLQQLIDMGLLKQRDQEGQVFSITDDGFRVADLLEKPAQPAKHELLSLVHQLRLISTSLPREPSKGEQVRNVTLWPEGDPSRLRTLAAAFGMTAAGLAAEAHRHLGIVAELAKSVQQTDRGQGFRWNTFDWGRWSTALDGAERTLLSLADEIDTDWRSKV